MRLTVTPNFLLFKYITVVLLTSFMVKLEMQTIVTHGLQK